MPIKRHKKIFGSSRFRVKSAKDPRHFVQIIKTGSSENIWPPLVTWPYLQHLQRHATALNLATLPNPLAT
jgi:hypothetical protein